jgi:hypothetical protein
MVVAGSADVETVGQARAAMLRSLASGRADLEPSPCHGGVVVSEGVKRLDDPLPMLAGHCWQGIAGEDRCWEDLAGRSPSEEDNRQSPGGV